MVGISKIDQIIFYTRHGLQPELTLPSDKVDGHIVCWFHKNKTKLIYQRWNEERLKNNRLLKTINTKVDDIPVRTNWT